MRGDLDIRSERDSFSAAVAPSPAPPGGGDNALNLSAAELQRRQRLVARANGGAVTVEQRHADAAARMHAAREAAERAQLDRQRDKPQLTNDFDPGPFKAKWSREGELARAIVGTSTPAGAKAIRPPPAGPSHAPGASATKPTRPGLRGRRAWKQRRRKPVEPNERTLQFARERGWTRARSQALATRIKQNDSIIAHPRAAESTALKLGQWSHAAIRRAMRAMRWTWGDEAARRHVAFWATLEDFARPRAWSRPRRVGGLSRYAGSAKYGMCVVGWAQTALALALSGAACTEGHSDPVDVKTVQRHAALASQHGALRVVVRNPDAEPELRGLPCDSNPRGWPINQYWLPAPNFTKPGFTGAHFDVDGNPIGLEESLALELPARAKRPRRLREEHRPPPLASPP